MEALIASTPAMDDATPEQSIQSARPKYGFIIFFSFLIVILGLGVAAFPFYIARNHTSLEQNPNFSLILPGAQGLLLLCFAGTMFYVIARLKKNDKTLDEYSEEATKLKANLNSTSNQLINTQSDLEYSQSQFSNTLFQLSNANLQFDIITSELDAAKRETDAIFATVRQGLFLLSPDGTISLQTSSELKEIFQTTELARRSLMHVIRPLLPEKRHKTISDYLELLFDARKNDKQLHRFNPLKRVELNFSSPEGGYQPKHVEFTFQRIVVNGAVTRVMVTALDVTERVKLEEQLRAGEVLREKQLELLFEILQVESSQLHKFIQSASDALGEINSIFMEPGLGGGAANPLFDKVNRVFRLAHNLKSEATSIGLVIFERTIHEIESQLNELRRSRELTNEDMLNVLVPISNFQLQLKETAVLIEKISGLTRSFGPGEGAEVHDRDLIGGIVPVIRPSLELKQTLDDLCRTITARRGKQARVEWHGEGFDELPATHRRMLQNAIVQLVRNSLVHGIEAPEERERLGKDPCGCVTVTFSRVPDSNQLQIICRDDGTGLNADAIRARAVSEGILKEDDGRVLSEQEICAMIFEPGFSTVADAHEDAGRGVGLDVVRDEIVNQLNGKIHMEFAVNQFCEFGFTIPTA